MFHKVPSPNPISFLVNVCLIFVISTLISWYSRILKSFFLVSLKVSLIVSYLFEWSQNQAIPNPPLKSEIVGLRIPGTVRRSISRLCAINHLPPNFTPSDALRSRRWPLPTPPPFPLATTTGVPDSNNKPFMKGRGVSGGGHYSGGDKVDGNGGSGE
jgi:hypothetical protein